MKATEQLRDFYAMLERLAERFGMNRLGDCTGQMYWPDRGVYFFLDPGEPRGGAPFGAEGIGYSSESASEFVLPRVVRVGTHALNPGSSSTLWKRLHQHRGQSTGLGNHRGSVFRKHVGRALLARDGVSHPTWGIRQTASRDVRLGEAELEMRVSDYLRDLLVVYVPVPDPAGPESLRAFVERNAIALLASEGRRFDPPTAEWLGLDSPSTAISSSGLWNVAHVGEKVDADFPDVLDRLVSATGARHAASGGTAGSSLSAPRQRSAGVTVIAANGPDAAGTGARPHGSMEPVTSSRRNVSVHPRGLSTSAQVLYWYMHAVSARALPVARAAWDSGLSERDVYKAIRDYPDLWTLDGINVRWTKSTRDARAHRLARRHGSNRGEQ